MANWIVVVDDDLVNLKAAGNILSGANMRVTALRSGQALLDYVDKNGTPDLVLLDIMMPEMDGFETLSRYRDKEKEMGSPEKPVIFLTAEDDVALERKGLETGVSDYIKKPLDPDILDKRVSNVLTIHDQMNRYEAEAEHDALTGLYNKATATQKIAALCMTARGYLLVVDLDSFKLVNDIYGHDMGDKVLIAFAALLKSSIKHKNILGRIGGDEFLVFTEGYELAELKEFTETLNKGIVSIAKELMGEQMSIPLGASVGAVAVPDMGIDFSVLFRMADKALYIVKNDGKHGYEVYTANTKEIMSDVPDDINLKTLSHILEERNIPQNAMWMGKEAFGNIYRYMIRYMDRYSGTAYKLLYNVRFEKKDIPEDIREDAIDHVRELLQNSLRNSDIMMQVGTNHFFLLLPEISEYNTHRVAERIERAWEADEYRSLASLHVEMDSIKNDLHDGPRRKDKGSDWVVVVDDDKANLMMIGNILSKNNMRVTALQSAGAFLEFMNDNRPDLILLDINMPDMDGFEAYKSMRERVNNASKIPVIFLTADESEETETKGLELGAMDFVRKPLVPGNLLLRVKHTLELCLLQNHLIEEVERKTEENKGLSIHIVKALADAIDAKDTYTNGHSGRVADYTRQIAERFGYTGNKLDDIYMMGLLHDVGKIGIPDAIINKPAKLSEEEFEVIKTHSVMGARILKRISEMPALSMGARWHHERYDGGGYPDGLKEDDIPEEARIIAVADAYDAMSSRRSYRSILPQEEIIEEIKKGRGTQFDPRFADIMLKMIEEDVEYRMREE